MSKKSLFVLSFFIVLAFFVARDREKTSIELEEDEKAVFVEKVEEVVKRVEETPIISGVRIEKIPEEENQISKAFKKCFPNKGLVSNLEDAKRVLAADLGKSKGKVQMKMKGYNLLNKKGEREFVDITTHFSGEGKAFTVLQRFGIAKDGLPESLSVKPEDRQNPTEEAIQSYIENRRIIELRKDLYQDFENGTVDYLIINDKIRSLKVSSGRSVFECAVSAETSKMECGCL